jgi:hypothetical protein
MLAMTRSAVTPAQLESPQTILQRFVESLNYDCYNRTRVFIDPHVASSLGITPPDRFSVFGTRSGIVSSTQLGYIEWTCKGLDCPDAGYVCPLTHRTFGEAELALEVIFVCNADVEIEDAIESDIANRNLANGDRISVAQLQPSNLNSLNLNSSNLNSSNLSDSNCDRWQRSHWYGQSFDSQDYRN